MTVLMGYFVKGKRCRVYEIIVPSVVAYDEILIVTQNTCSKQWKVQVL